MGVRTYGPYQILAAGDMSASLSTNGVDMLSLPFGAIELVWTGTPTGTFTVDGSIDAVTSPSGVTNWFNTGTTVTAPAGSASSTLVNLTTIGYRWIRVSYTRVSGSGSLAVTIFGKGGFSG